MGSRSRIRAIEALSLILRPALRPILQLLAVLSGAAALLVLLSDPFSTPRHNPDRVRHLAATLQIAKLKDALELYHSHCGRYPGTREGLSALRFGSGSPEWRGPYVPDIPTDPWGRPYVYDASTLPPRVISYGRDGVPGSQYSDDDVSSAHLTPALPESSVERRTRLLLIGTWFIALAALGLSIHGLIRLHRQHAGQVRPRPPDPHIERAE